MTKSKKPRLSRRAQREIEPLVWQMMVFGHLCLEQEASWPELVDALSQKLDKKMVDSAVYALLQSGAIRVNDNHKLEISQN